MILPLVFRHKRYLLGIMLTQAGQLFFFIPPPFILDILRRLEIF